MATQYTATLAYNGQSFRQYRISCAMKLGVPVSEDGLGRVRADFRLPDTEADYSDLEKARTEVERLGTTDKRKAAQLGASIKKRRLYLLQQEYKQAKAQNRRLLAMKPKVAAWQPTNESEVKLKAVMLAEIDDALSNLDFYERELPVRKGRSPAWFLAEEQRCAQVRLTSARHQYAGAMNAAREKERLFRELRRTLRAA